VKIYRDGVNIGEYLPRRSGGKSSPIFIAPEENCFCIITQVNIRETEKIFIRIYWLQVKKSAHARAIFTARRINRISKITQVTIEFRAL
jgi:hypothetical protein